MKTKTFFLFSFLIFNGLFIYSQNYNRIMGKSIKKAIGSDLKDYLTFSYPTDNYGLITSYENMVSDANFICDMWNCIGVKDENIPSSNNLNMKGFAAVGSGGIVELSQKKKTQVATNIILPKIYNVVGVTGGFKKQRTTEINITIGKAYLRKLRRQEFINYINDLDNNLSLKKAFNNGDLVLVVSDCIIENMTVSVKVDDETKVELDSKLESMGTSVSSKIFKDASLSVNLERTSNGTYTFKISQPVVFARLVKKQPTGGTLSTVDDFSDWQTISINLDKSKF